MLTFVAVLLLWGLDACGIFLLYQAGLRDVAAFILAGAALHAAAAIVLTRLLMIFFPIREGTFDIPSPEYDRWRAQAVLYMFACDFLGFLIPFCWKPYWYRLFGAKIAGDTVVVGRIVDCSLIAIERGASLGTDGILTGHFITPGQIRIGRIHIGCGVMVGIRAVVFPGVTVGDNALIGAMSLIPAGRTIGSGEVWSGNPARRLPAVNRLHENDAAERLASFAPASQREAQAAGKGAPRDGATAIQCAVRKYLTEDLALPADGLVDDDFFSVLDSLALAQLLCFINERFGVHATPEDVTPRHFASLVALARFIEEKQRRAAVEPVAVG
jgi:acyl carrier protein